MLHQSQATDARTLLLSAGSSQGVSPFDPVVSPEGLIGVVLSTAERTSIAMTWAHPEFRVSAFTVTGNAAGVVAPSLSAVSGEGALEFRGVPYRDSVPPGSLVLSSGLGGVYPKGIPVGTVTGLVREQAGWERVYRLLPAANPGSVGHVLILDRPAILRSRAAFPSDSLLQAQRLDSLLRARRADSLAQAAQGRGGRPPRLARRVGSARPDSGAAPAAPAAAPAPSRPHRRQPAESGARRSDPMMPTRANRVQLVLVLLLMVVLQFYLRPRLWGPRVSPDFLFLGLMLVALRSSPGIAALAGFLVGLAGDALTPGAVRGGHDGEHRRGLSAPRGPGRSSSPTTFSSTPPSSASGSGCATSSCCC